MATIAPASAAPIVWETNVTMSTELVYRDASRDTTYYKIRFVTSVRTNCQGHLFLYLKDTSEHI